MVNLFIYKPFNDSWLIRSCLQKLSVRLMYKPPTGIYFRQIINLNSIDVCQLLDGANKNFMPIVKNYKDYIFEKFSFLPKKCPSGPGKYYGYNISISGNDGSEFYSLISPVSLPNGIYRFILRFYSPLDREGVTIWITYQIYDVNNVENIMK